MKVGKLNREKRYDSRNDKSLGIQTYGESNDYPQHVEDIVNASTTGKSCVDVYAKFISGRGFTDEKLSDKIVSKQGHTLDHVLNELSKDYALWGGFAVHVNYNANHEIISIQHIPLETIRFEKFDENRHFNKVALHPDWGRNYTALYKWKKEDIEFIHWFNPDPEVIDQQVEDAGGWGLYKGQVYYFSNKGEKTYPLPKFDNVLTDMNTQESISDVSNRNAVNGFFPGAMIVDIMNSDETKDQENETEKSLMTFQGAQNAGKWMYVQVDSKEEIPTVIQMESTNYDKQFDSTRKAVREDIGAAFSQPPILRSEDVGSNFGSTAMKEAYSFYNSVTENERFVIERTFDTIFKNWHERIDIEFSIDPLSYDVETTLAEELGEKGFTQFMEIIRNENLTTVVKKNMIKVLFNLDDESINLLIPMQHDNNL